MGNAPLKKWKSAVSWNLSVDAWQNDKGIGFTIQKRYKDDAGEWRESNTLFPSDLAALSELCRRALEWNDTEGQTYRAKKGEQPAADTEINFG